MTTKYGDITPRQAGHSVANFLKRAAPNLIIERFGQAYPLPRNATKTAKFRRYFMEGATGSAGSDAGAFNVPKGKVIAEGVTPAGSKLAHKDYEVSIVQYGDWMGFTDVMQDTHEDFPQALREMTDILGEQAAQTMEELRFNVLKAGTNVFYADLVTARSDVDAPIDLALQRRIVRALKRQNARPHTSMITSSPSYQTKPIEPAFIALVHPDLENDIRNLVDANGNPAYINTKHYAGVEPIPGEIGSVENVRYVSSTVFEAWESAGAAVGVTGMLAMDNTNIDVYPILYLARDAFGTVPLKGAQAASITVVQPKPTETDPLAQRGTAGWKTWHATVILQDAFMIRAEVAATA